MAHLNAPSLDISRQPNKCKFDRSYCHKQEMDEPPRKQLGNQPDKIKLLYSMVNETETPLPRQWGSKKEEKFSTLGLTHNDLRVFYKGSGKDHNDAASIRTSHPIPTSCGVYYFEVKVVSKGRDGFMGIGLTSVQKMENRLPGWDKNSYGYHGDDGNSFCSSGQGQPYGPTFSTGDVIGCCMNFIDNTCFYTRNGVNLGIAFRDLPSTLYPTVGLQTPGEVLEANFGQSQFVFDFEDYLKEWHQKIKHRIENFVGSSRINISLELPRLVLSYLARQGYPSTAQSFAKMSGQKLEEDLSAIRNRQRIQHLILSGRISEAILMTQRQYPGLLSRELDLLFQLKCRQFIEMVNGVDDESSTFPSPANLPSPKMSSPPSDANKPSVPASNGKAANKHDAGFSSPTNFATNGHSIADEDDDDDVEMETSDVEDEEMDSERMPSLSNGDSLLPHNHSSSGNHVIARHSPNNNDADAGGKNDHPTIDDDDDDDDDDDMSTNCPPPHCEEGQRSNKTISIEKILRFGRDLHLMGEQLKKEKGRNEENEKALKDAFSLLAYADPWNSPVGYQLDPVQREAISKALNGAILEEIGLAKQSPLEISISQATLCLNYMSRTGIGSCAFTNLSTLLS